MQLQRAPRAAPAPARTALSTRCSATTPPPPRVSRRLATLALPAAPALLAAAWPHAARAAELRVDSETVGFGKRTAADGDLLLVHYRGTLAENGTTFDSTLGGAVVRTSGSSASVQPAEAVPRVLSLRAGEVQPGLTAGLRAALLGMRVGGRRTVTVPPELGFGQTAVTAPYAVVPPGSTLMYDIQLLRLSSTGPDALLDGIANCGIGGAAAQSAGCAAIEPRE